MLPGTVVYVNDSHPDNQGNRRDAAGINNEIIVSHAGGLYSRYAHMRQGSALVSVNQIVTADTQLARVGNSGQTSGPHLHFHMYRITSSGHVAAVPVTVASMYDPEQNPVTGVPASSSDPEHARWVTP